MINPRALPAAGLGCEGIRSLSAPAGAPGDVACGAAAIPRRHPPSPAGIPPAAPARCRRPGVVVSPALRRDAGALVSGSSDPAGSARLTCSTEDLSGFRAPEFAEEQEQPVSAGVSAGWPGDGQGAGTAPAACARNQPRTLALGESKRG